jgi:tripartite-type tricarboxylate transporter receptor subunit TctC
MPRPRFAAGIFAAALMTGCTGVVCAQTYPNKPIRIVTSEPGGGADFGARIIAQGLTDSFGQQAIVDNRAGGSIPGEIVSRAPPDGYTLLYYGSTLWILPLIRKDVRYDASSDFSPITLAVTSPNVLVVHPTVAAKSIAELIALAKARPGQINYSSGPPGASNHLAAELFKSMAGINLMRIPYKGSGQALNALFGGEVQLTFATAALIAPHLKTARVRALAVTSARPFAAFPELPTIAASGLPGYEAVQMFGLFAPAKMPAALIARLNREVVRILATPEVKHKFALAGAETVGSSPSEFAAKIKSEVGSMGKVIRQAGIRDE